MTVECSECGKEFDSERGLHIHEAQMHKDEEKPEKSVEQDEDTKNTVTPDSKTLDLSLDLKQIGGLAFIIGTLFGLVIGLSIGLAVSPGEIDAPSEDDSGNGDIETISELPYDVNFGMGSENVEWDNQTVELDGRPYMGADDAPVTMVSYEDFFCPYCTGFHNEDFASANGMYSAFGSIIENHIETGEVKYYFKNFPVSGGERPAEVAECVLDNGDSEAYWTFHHNQFQNFEQLRNLQQQDSERYDEIMVSWGEQLGLNEGFESCLDNPGKIPVLQSHTSEAQNLGASATPTNFIDGETVEGAQPYSAFETVIEDKLSQ